MGKVLTQQGKINNDVSQHTRDNWVLNSVISAITKSWIVSATLARSAMIHLSIYDRLTSQIQNCGSHHKQKALIVMNVLTEDKSPEDCGHGHKVVKCGRTQRQEYFSIA